jgi:hypothetical protein
MLLLLIFNPQNFMPGYASAAIVTYPASNISTSRLVALAADGASVMTGHKAGVAARLRHLNPHVISVHCTAHRLILAVSQTSNSIDYIGNTFETTLRHVYDFFHNSAVRTSTLTEIQQLLDQAQLKLVEPNDVRWLSHEQA